MDESIPEDFLRDVLKSVSTETDTKEGVSVGRVPRKVSCGRSCAS